MSDLSLQLTPVLPVWVIVLLCAALLGALAYGSVTLIRRQVPHRAVVILGVLRVAIILLFALVLLHPVVSYTREIQRPPEMLVLLDTSESMALPGSTEGATRLHEVIHDLDRRGLAKELATRFDLRWFSFHRSASPLEGDDWTGVKADGAGTQYSESLLQAWKYHRASSPSGARPERVLLISDGHDRGKEDIVDTARRLGVAVDVLMPGSPPKNQMPAPIRVADVQGAQRVLLGSETHFLVTLRSERTKTDRKVTVRMLEAAKELDATQVVLRAGRTEERVRLAHRPGEVGSKRYEFRADDSPPFSFSAQVMDGKHEVLVLEDSWRWEFKFLRRVLEEDPSFRFTGLLSRGGGAFMQFAAPDRQSQLVGFPQDRSQLAGFDTIVVGDVNPKRWPRELARSLRQMVVENGRSLVVLAGPNLAHWTDEPDLLALLPVEIARDTANPVSGPVPIRVTVEGARSPFFLQPGSRLDQAALPPLDQIYPPLRKKPAATVLLEAAKLANASGPLIVMAEQTVGRGRVLFIGTDTLWKWQTLTTAADEKTTPFHLFWQQSLRALAPTKPTGSAVNLWLQPHRSRYQARQRIAIRAEIEATGPLSQPTVAAVVSLPSGKTFPLTFSADPSAPNAFVAEFEARRPGAYRLTASVVSNGRPAAEAATVVDVDESKPESEDVPVNAENLIRIASSTGGTVIDVDDPETWPPSAGAVTVIEPVTVDLWNRSYLLIVLVLIAGVDWLLRLLRGYV